MAQNSSSRFGTGDVLCEQIARFMLVSQAHFDYYYFFSSKISYCGSVCRKKGLCFGLLQHLVSQNSLNTLLGFSLIHKANIVVMTET